MWNSWLQRSNDRGDEFACIEVILPEHMPACWNRIPYRNFNECPHCLRNGVDGLLLRYSEGFPIISRSDGSSYHLLLADRPRPFPAERRHKITSFTACFWYEMGWSEKSTHSVLAFLDRTKKESTPHYRRLEEVADVLSLELTRKGKLEFQYDFRTQDCPERTSELTPSYRHLPALL